MSCKVVYAGQKMTEQQFEEKYIPKQGEVIEYNGVEYVVYNSNKVGSQLLKGEQYLSIAEDGEAHEKEMTGMLDQIPLYNLDPVGRYTVEFGGIDPLFDVPLTALLKDGFTKTGKISNEKNPFGGTFSNTDDLFFQLNSLRDYNNQFDKDLVQAKMGKLPSGHVLQLGNPGAILQKAGLDNIPIEFSIKALQDTIDKPQKEHKFDYMDLLGLVKGMNMPEIVVSDKDYRDRILVSTPLQDSKGRRFNVSIEMNKTKRNGSFVYEVNNIVTVFPRTSDYGLLKQIEAGDLLYVNKDKALKYLEERWNNPTGPSKNSELGNKVRKIINDFVNTVSEEDVKYYQLMSSMQDQADEALDKRLVDFLKPLGFTVEMLDNLKQRTGVDAAGAVDIINKIIAISKGKAKLDTLPEETAHVFVELLGNQHPIVKALMNSITRWEGYEAVRDEYYKQYQGNEIKIKKEAIGKLISQYIVGHRKADPTILDYIKKAIQAVLKMFSVDFVDAHTLAEDIAIDILSKNYSKIKRRMPEGARLTDYESSLEKDALVKNISDRLRNTGFYLTGSLALRKQGTVYRRRDENIHDLDFKVPPRYKDNWREVVAREFNGTEFPVAYTFSRKGETIYGLNINGVTVDFFVKQGNDVPEPMPGNFSRWQDIFAAKLGMGGSSFGREKDLTDFMVFQPLEKPKGFDNPDHVYFQLDEKTKEDQQKIARSFEQKRERHGLVKMEKTLEFQDDEGTGYKRMKNGVLDWVQKRVTDFVKEKKSAQTLAKFENAPKERKREWKEKAEWGTKFHKDSETIIKAALDTDGYLKDQGDIRMSDIETSLPASAFKPMFDYLVGSKEVPGILYTQFPQGTLFRVEEILYDEKRDVAGTVDLMGITPDVKIHIIDWKTKFLNKQLYDDVPFFNQRDYRIQLGQYKNILKTYNIKPENVSVAQAQPVVFEGAVSKEGSVTLSSIELPNIDVKKEERKYLIPVSVEEQSTGNEAIDSFIDSLYKLYEDVYRTPTQDKYLKIQQLNSIASAIRELQIRQNFAPVAQEAQNFMFSVERALKDYNDLFFKEGLPIEAGFENLQGGKEAFDSLLSRMTTILENVNKYSGLYGMFDDVYGSEDLTEEQQKIADTLKRIAGDAAHKSTKIENAFKGMMEWFALKYGVEHILDAEKTVSGAFDRNVQSTSRIQTYAIQLFYKLESEAKSKRDVAIQEKLSSFKEVLEPFKQWAASSGLAARNYFSILTGDANSNKLIPKLKKEVYQLLEQATSFKSLDKKWIEQNIDLEKVKEIGQAKIEAYNKRVDADKYSTDPEEDNRTKKRMKDEYASQWDFSDTGLGWYQVGEFRRNIREDLWYSDEYKKLREQPAALALYNWIEQFNEEALRSGYHDSTFGFSRRFLPWVKGTFLDKLGRKGMSAFSDSLRDIYTLHEDEKQQYGKGESVELPRFFTKDARKDTESMAELSTDLGSNMALYIQAVLDYQAMDEIEDYADAIITLEKSKDHLVVGKDGRIQQENGKLKTEEGNEENARLLQSQVEMLLYKRMYDKTSGLPEEANKAIEKLNNFMRLKVFSLNLIMPFVNTVGSNLQAGINSGRVFKGREWLKNEARLVGNLFEGQEGNLIKGLVDYFMPLLENENHRTGKQLSLQALKKWTIGDVLLGHIRKSDRIIQLATAMTMLENTMVDEKGNLVNIREHYLNSPEYRNRYTLSQEARKQLEQGFEKKVQELKDQHSVLKKASFNKDGVLEIEGVARNSETFHQYRRKIQNEISNIVGQVSEDEKRDMERNVLLKSMMMFKSWIPNLTQKRFGQIQKNARTDQYEIGRARVFFSLLFYGAGEKRSGNIFSGVLQGMKDLRDMKAGNENGIRLLGEYYERMAKDYYERTGKELQMTPEEFYDLTRQAIAMQAKDMIALTSLILMGVGIGAIPPDDDADKGSKNVYKTVSRIADKLKDEVTFYYNPLSAKSILGGGLVPSIGVVTDALSTLGTIGKDLTSPEDVQKTTYSTKAVLKNFPLFFQGTQFFLPLISPETASDMGVKVSSNNNYR